MIPGIVASVLAGAAGESHRYWRLDQPDCSEMEIQEVGLYVGSTRVSDGITPTFDTSPTYFGGGDINTLTNGVYNHGSNRVYWASTTGWAMKLDFGSGVALDGIDEGSFDNAGRFIAQVRISYSDDGSAWTVHATPSGLIYPGERAQSNLVTF